MADNSEVSKDVLNLLWEAYKTQYIREKGNRNNLFKVDGKRITDLDEASEIVALKNTLKNAYEYPLRYLYSDYLSE
jgi:hypothetical protein